MFDFTKPDTAYYCEKKEPFIGRERILRELWWDVFCPLGEGTCVSLCGPHGVGKSALVRQLRAALEEAGEEEKNTYFLYYDTPTSPEYADVKFALKIIAQLKKKLPMEKLRHRVMELELADDLETCDMQLEVIQSAYALVEKDQWTDENLNRSQWRNNVIENVGETGIFPEYRRLGYRFVLVMEEFDRAPIAFPDNEMFRRLYGFSPKSTQWDKLSMDIILVSRQAAGKLGKGRMADGSSFGDAYKSKVVSGFTNRELEEYFATYQTLPCGVPDAEKRQQILYLCGRHPALLMDMRRESKNIPADCWDVNRVWESNTRLFHDRFATMCRQLETERCSDHPTQSLMQCFLRTFVYQGLQFVHGEEAFNDDQRELENAGYVTSPAVDEQNLGDFSPSIFALCGMRDDPEEPTLPEPISPSFVDYVRCYYLPQNRDSAVNQVLLAEQKVRSLVRSRMQAAYGDCWKKAVAKIVRNSKMRYQFAENTNRFTAQYGGGSVDLLDAMSFADYAEIITQESQIFGGGYSGKDAEKWVEDWKLFKAIRDIHAHNNTQVLNRYTVQDLRAACERLGKWIEEVSRMPMPEEQPAEKSLVEWGCVEAVGRSRNEKGNWVYAYTLGYRWKNEQTDYTLRVIVALNGKNWAIHPEGGWPKELDDHEKETGKNKILTLHMQYLEEANN